MISILIVDIALYWESKTMIGKTQNTFLVFLMKIYLRLVDSTGYFFIKGFPKVGGRILLVVGLSEAMVDALVYWP